MDNEQMMSMDPFILLSWLNMKLRDEPENLEGLCAEFNMDREKLVSRLKAVGYRYDNKINQFISMG